MTNNEIIEQLKAEYPTLRIGNEESGYTDLNTKDYEATIAQWAHNLIAAQSAETEAKAAKATAQAKLAALGLTADDLKALGL